MKYSLYLFVQLCHDQLESYQLFLQIKDGITEWRLCSMFSVQVH